MHDIVYLIGYPKAGSSSLREIFKESSGVEYIYEPGLTNLLYGVSPLVSFEDSIAIDKYLKLLHLDQSDKVNVVGDETLMGLFYSGHYNYREISRRIKKAHPNAKIIITIREQLKIIDSSYRHYISRGGVLTIDRWFKKGKSKRINGASLKAYEYSRIISYYIEIFGRSNVCVLPIELKNKDPQMYIDRLTDFVGVELYYPRSDKRNKGPSLRDTRIQRITNIFNPDAEYDDVRDRTALSNSFFYSVSTILAWIIEPVRLFLSDKPNVLADDKVRRIYAEDNMKLQSIIGIDLSELGYLVHKND